MFTDNTNIETTMIIVIKAKDLKPALGHQKPVFRTGVNRNKSDRRNNTRSSKTRKAIADQQ